MVDIPPPKHDYAPEIDGRPEKPVGLRLALDELVGAVRDAQRRYAAGDMRALESHMLAATLRQAERELAR